MYIFFLVLITGGYIVTLVVWHYQRGEIRSLNSEINSIVENWSASDESSYSAVTISPTEQAVYFPLARLKLPDTTLNEGLIYSFTGPHRIYGDKKLFPANLSISTHDLAANAVSTTQQFDCSEIVYADFVTPSYPINPMWKSDGSTKLSDGRTMNVYYAPSIAGCQTSWRFNDVNSKAVADSLKDAVSY
jgi:hypothetical protein